MRCSALAVHRRSRTVSGAALLTSRVYRIASRCALRRTPTSSLICIFACTTVMKHKMSMPSALAKAARTLLQAAVRPGHQGTRARCPDVQWHFAAATRRDLAGALARGAADRRPAAIERHRYAIDGANDLRMVFVTAIMGAVVGGSIDGGAAQFGSKCPRQWRASCRRQRGFNFAFSQFPIYLTPQLLQPIARAKTA